MQGHKYLQDLAAQISITQIFVQNLSKYVMGSKLHRRDKNIHSYRSQSLYLSQTTPMHNWLLGPLTGVNSDFPTLALILSSSKYFRYIFQPCPSFYPRLNISDRSLQNKMNTSEKLETTFDPHPPTPHPSTHARYLAMNFLDPK